MRILLIDDEVRKAKAIVSYFQEVRGWHVEMAPGPDRAVELLKGWQERSYDLIILDIMMDPGTVIALDQSGLGKDTGIILLRLIKELTGGGARVVLYTARTDLDYLKRDGLVAAYIQKPRTIKEFEREIDDLISGLEVS